MDGRFGTAYDADFYAWTREQAAALRAEAARRSNAPIDWENLAEEIESMGRSERSKIESHLEVLMVHLLKWLYRPDLRERCERGWRNTIKEQRFRIARVIRQNPSLKHAPAEILAEIYEETRFLAAAEAECDMHVFPIAPPFTLEQALDPRYPIELFPEGDDD